MICKNCQWWDVELGVVDEHGITNAFCHRYPPRVTMALQNNSIINVMSWPGTKEDQWCGEFTPRKKK